ncbi:MAG: epimerase [Chloroflexi bacterium RBG_16_54_18]|nr:MAG: epimerase [Chloroflexi bacterium RBG_16_54_18]
MSTPDKITNEGTLLDVLTSPREVLVEYIPSLKSPLVILGAGGKMGPSLAYLAYRSARAANSNLEIIAVDRFQDGGSREWLETKGIRTVKKDLLNRSDVESLPDTENLIYLVGMKFGTMSNPSMTWSINALIPANICHRYQGTRMVALSTGNVYPLVEVAGGGALESDSQNPVGEYAISCLARERVFEYNSQVNHTPIVLIRLNYAVELRYGVLYDIAQKVFANQPVDVTMGYFNCIWQGDANDMIIRSLPLAKSPVKYLNLTSPRIFSVREIALKFGELFGHKVNIIGKEAPTALVSNAGQASQLLGEPSTPLDTILAWIANWIEQGGRSLGKPTHFEVRDGGY